MEIKDIMELGVDEETSKKIFDIHKKELNNALVNFYVDTALIKAGAKNIKAARALVDFDAAKKGDINSQIDKLLKEKDSSFLSPEKLNPPHSFPEMTLPFSICFNLPIDCNQ